MKLDQLKELAKQGKLILHKYSSNTYFRNRYIYKSTDPESDDFYKIKETKKIPYKRISRFCRTTDMPEHTNYKITAKDYKELLTAGAKEEN